MAGYNFIDTKGAGIKAWTNGVPVEDAVMAAQKDLVEVVHTLK